MTHRELVEKLAMYGKIKEGKSIDEIVSEFEKLDPIEQMMVNETCKVVLAQCEVELEGTLDEFNQIEETAPCKAEVMTKLFMESIARLETIHSVTVKVPENTAEFVFMKRNGAVLLFASLDYDNNLFSIHGNKACDVLDDDTIVLSSMVQILEIEYAQ